MEGRQYEFVILSYLGDPSSRKHSSMLTQCFGPGNICRQVDSSLVSTNLQFHESSHTFFYVRQSHKLYGAMKIMRCDMRFICM